MDSFTWLVILSFYEVVSISMVMDCQLRYSRMTENEESGRI
jgi:hypothetical protein